MLRFGHHDRDGGRQTVRHKRDSSWELAPLRPRFQWAQQLRPPAASSGCCERSRGTRPQGQGNLGSALGVPCRRNTRLGPCLLAGRPLEEEAPRQNSTRRCSTPTLSARTPPLGHLAAQHGLDELHGLRGTSTGTTSNELTWTKKSGDEEIAEIKEDQAPCECEPEPATGARVRQRACSTRGTPRGACSIGRRCRGGGACGNRRFRLHVTQDLHLMATRHASHVEDVRTANLIRWNGDVAASEALCIRREHGKLHRTGIHHNRDLLAGRKPRPSDEGRLAGHDGESWRRRVRSSR
jgi:hypothetical protein